MRATPTHERAALYCSALASARAMGIQGHLDISDALGVPRDEYHDLNELAWAAVDQVNSDSDDPVEFYAEACSILRNGELR